MEAEVSPLARKLTLPDSGQWLGKNVNLHGKSNVLICNFWHYDNLLEPVKRVGFLVTAVKTF